MKYLLDTNALRELGKTAPHKNVAAWLKSVDDAGLAATALVHSLTVVTRNTADCSGHGVKLIDPFKAARRQRD